MATKEDLIKKQQTLMTQLSEVNKQLNGENDTILANIEQVMKSNQYVLIVDKEQVLDSVMNYIIVKCDEFSYDVDNWGNLHIQGVKVVLFCDRSGMATFYKLPGNWDIGSPSLNGQRIADGHLSGITPEALKTLLQKNMASAYRHISGNSLNAIECSLKLTIGLPKVTIEG